MFFQNMLPISYYILPCNNEFSLWQLYMDPRNSFGNSRPYFKVFQNSKATSESVKKLTQTIIFSAAEIKKLVTSFIDSPKYRIGISNWGTVLGGWTWITRLEDDNQTTAPQKDPVHGDLPTLIWLFNLCMVYLENFWQFLIGSNIPCLARDSLSYLRWLLHALEFKTLTRTGFEPGYLDPKSRIIPLSQPGFSILWRL